MVILTFVVRNHITSVDVLLVSHCRVNATHFKQYTIYTSSNALGAACCVGIVHKLGKVFHVSRCKDHRLVFYYNGVISFRIRCISAVCHRHDSPKSAIRFRNTA